MKHWSETRAVLDRLAAIERAGGGLRAALATVVGVRGSAYRHEGAKMLVAEDGTTTGNVSGGCLEEDVREVGLGVIRSGRAELRSYCAGSDEIAAWDLGLGCDGQVDVYVEPAPRGRPEVRNRLDGREAFAVCTLLAGTGGRLVISDSRVEGSLGSAELDARAVAAAREALGAARSGIHELAGHQVFIDAFLPPPRLILFGAGEDARPLARFAVDAGFQVTVVDHRPAYLAPDRFPIQVRRVEYRQDDLPETLRLDKDCYAIVMNHHFAHDEAVARFLLGTGVPYIGMLGPRQRTERILADLARERPLGDAERARVYGPVGLDIGTDGAEQVALSVLAEVLSVMSGREARSLRERPTPIHADERG